MKKRILEKGKRGLAWALTISMLLGSNPAGSMVMAGETIGEVPEQLEYTDWLDSGEDMIIDEMGGDTLAPTENKNENTGGITVDEIITVETPDDGTNGSNQQEPDEEDMEEVVCRVGEEFWVSGQDGENHEWLVLKNSPIRILEDADALVNVVVDKAGEAFLIHTYEENGVMRMDTYRVTAVLQMEDKTPDQTEADQMESNSVDQTEADETELNPADQTETDQTQNDSGEPEQDQTNLPEMGEDQTEQIQTELEETEQIQTEPDTETETEAFLLGEPDYLDPDEMMKVFGAQDETAFLRMALNAEEGSLQAQINAVAEGESAQIKLDRDYTENIVIWDGQTISLDLNGYVLSPDTQKRIGNATINTITVYGTLVLQNSGNENGAVANRASAGPAERVRGVAVRSGGEFVLQSGVIENFHVTGNGGGVLVEEHGVFTIEGGSIRNNTATQNGGGVFTYDGNSFSMAGGTICENTAQDGGGVFAYLVSEGSYVLDNQTLIVENTATGNGGGFYLYEATEAFTIQTSNIRRNKAEADGGGIYLAKKAAICTITDGADVAENASGRYGGGIYLTAGTQLVMDGGTVRGNWLYGNKTTLAGGGIYLASSNGARSSFTMTGGRISENTSKDTGLTANIWGGGIYVGQYASVTLKEGTRIEENTNFTHGGGLFVDNYSVTLIEGGFISGNVIHGVGYGYGAGLFHRSGTGAKLTMTGGEISHNSADGNSDVHGGGIYTEVGMTMSGGAVCENMTRGNGGGVWGAVTMTGDALIRDNQAWTGGGTYGTTRMHDRAQVINNYASGEGGGIYGTLYLYDDAKVAENTASSSGGGVRGTVVMEGGAIEHNNSKASGGGVYWYGGGTSTLAGGRISENTASGVGGGIHQSYVGGKIVITGTEITDNKSNSNGGGICAEGSVTMTGGTVRKNTAIGSGGGIYLTGSVGKSGANSITGGMLCDNTAFAAKGGHDLYQSGSTSKNEADFARAPILILGTASDFISPSGEPVIDWYEERSQTSVTETKEEMLQYGENRAYTFRYGNVVAQLGSEVYGSVQEAIDMLAVTGQEDGQAENAVITMLADSIECVQIPEGVSVTLDLAGHTIRGLSSSVIYVEQGAKLTIDDTSEMKNGVICGGSGTANPNRTDKLNSGGGLFVLGDVTLKNGHIKGNTASYGAGVYVGGLGSFTMDGGYVEENRGMGILVNHAENVSGVQKNSVFTMNGGVIRANTGSGVRLQDSRASFYMTGGVIEGNSTDMGSGIRMYNSSKAYVSGGEIRNNTATNVGGAVYLEGSGTLFEFTGGRIENNKAANGGGGIYGTAYTTVRIPEGATGVITGNQVTTGNKGEGGGIYAVANMHLELNGGQIYGNICNGDAKDICAVADSGNYRFQLFAASDMGFEEYDSWYDGYDSSYIKESLAVIKKPHTYYLTAAKSKEDHTNAVARIGSGDEVQQFDKLSDAIETAKGGEIIYLLKDVCERVTIREGQNVVIDLNGYTLSTNKNNIFYLTGGALKLQDSSQSGNRQEDAKEGSAGGLLTPAEGCVGARAIYMTAGVLDVSGITVTGFGNPDSITGSLAMNGGAIYARYGCSIRIGEGTVFTDNCATYGGALQVEGFSSNNASTKAFDLEITGASFRNNQAKYGGAVNTGSVLYAPSTVSIQGSEFVGNTATISGGGLRIYGFDNAAEPLSVTISDTLFQNNVTKETSDSNSGGGGAYICHAKSIDIVNSRFLNNTARRQYGGLYCSVRTGNLVNVKNTEISGNRALLSNVGGARLGGTVTVTDCTITNNRIERNICWYGGLYLTGITKLEGNTKISGNYAYYNSGVCAAGTSFIMEDGVEVSNNTDRGYGAVCVAGCANAYLNGGVINSNSGTGLQVRAGNNTHRVYLRGVQIRDNKGRGVTISNNARAETIVQEGTVIERNSGGILLEDYTTLTVEGGKIRNNTSTGNGGGICVSWYGKLNMTGGEITGNQAAYGGGIYNRQRPNKDHSYLGWEDTISGGLIADNVATGSGGGIYNANGNTILTINGGVIRDNKTGGNGGGLAMESADSNVTVLKGAQLYHNTAAFGQDVYAAYNASYKSSHLCLPTAAGMFEAADGKSGMGWYDEGRDHLITDGITYTPVLRSYGLTLKYETEEIVAKIGDTPFTTVQKAVDAIVADTDHAVYGEHPTIVLVKEAAGNVRIPGGMELTLNLNGYTLQGTTTAITCYGKLHIKDVKDETEPGPDGAVGSIIGNAPESGGAVLVRSGGIVTMESGQISQSHAGGAVGDNSSYGGGGVCVDGGTFELTGTASINNCSSMYGAAVMVKSGASVFRMSGGVIENNTAKRDGVIWIPGGVFQMTGGTIRNNTSSRFGIIFQSGGKSRFTGGLIEGNKAVNDGGAVCLTGGTMQVGGVTVQGNKTTNATSYGGAFRVSGGTLTIGEGTIITKNESTRGGAIYQYGGVIRMTGGSITENRAQFGGGLAQAAGNEASFLMTDGELCNNTSTRTGAGNDIYSRYEGTGVYPGKSYPKTTLIPAVDMGNTDYNVWKDDSYNGTVRSAEQILEGQYVTGRIIQSFDLQLTADRYGDTERSENETTMEVKSLNFHATEGIKDGVTGFNNTAAVLEAEKYGDALADEWENGINGPAKEWSAGNDSSNNNGIVRTFDRIMYKMITTVQDASADKENSGDQESDLNANGSNSGGNEVDLDENAQNPGNNESNPDAEAQNLDGQELSSDGDEPENPIPAKKQKLKLWLEAELPLSAEQAEFVYNESMEVCEISETEAEDGTVIQKMRGYWEIENEAGTQENVISINVKAMKNGELIEPVFRQWIGDNPENEAHPLELSPEAPTRVSATDKYNVSLLRNSALAYTGYFNLETGEEVNEREYKESLEDPERNGTVVYGTMLGYGITLSLKNDGAANRLQGIQFPEGDIDFDLHLRGSLYLEGEELTDDKGNSLKQAPYIWAYKENVNTAYGTNLSNTNYGFNMDWNDEDDITRTTRYAYAAAPYNSGGGNSGCYSGGVWHASGAQPEQGDAETVVHFKISGYTVNPAYDNSSPSYASSGGNSEFFGSNQVKPFSAGYVQILFPVNPEVTKGGEGYLEIDMEGIVSDLQIRDSSGNTAEGKDTSNVKDADMAKMQDYFGSSYREHATGEMLYQDNYLSHVTGMYVYNDNYSNGDAISKTNYFNNGSNGILSGTGGTGTTPLGSQVYIGADLNYSSKVINTQDKNSGHYIAPEDFDPQIHNIIEYNYMTGVNLLQKFDADAYTPVGTSAVTNVSYEQNQATRNIGNGAFIITTTEGPTTWSKNNPIKTMSYNLTILYAAKPDGTNWRKDESPSAFRNRGGEDDMVAHHEEDLIYFDTLQALYDYFGYDADGISRGKCVAILYQFRDCCIRTGRRITVTSKMNVTNDFADTGKTFCTTNDAKIWTVYRPTYKEAYAKGAVARQEVVYQFNWRDVSYNGQSGVYGTGNGTLPENYYDENTGRRKLASGSDYTDSYVKTEYEDGSPVGGTHTGWRRGNTLLLYTMDSNVTIGVADIIQGSANTPKTQYYLSNGERTANFVVTPTIQKSSAIKNHELIDNGSQPAQVEIRLTLPKHLNFNEGSIRIDTAGSGYADGELIWDVDYEKEMEKDAQGNPTDIWTGRAFITLRTSVSDIKKKLPKIRYSCTIGTPGAPKELDVPNGTVLTTQAKINTTYSEINQIACNAKSDSVSIDAVANRNDSIYMDVKSSRTELGDDLVYYLNYSNRTEAPVPIQMYDVLPYNGDGRGTSMTGGYRVSAIRMKFSEQKDYEKFLAEGSLKYRKDMKAPGAGKAEMEEAAKLLESGDAWSAVALGKVDGSWVVEYSGENLIQYAANGAGGIGFCADLPQVTGAKSVIVEVVLSPQTADAGPVKELITSSGKTQQGGNTYWNNLFYKSGSDPVISGKAYIDTVERSISGTVWMDQNQDGKYVVGTNGYASTDRTLKNVDVFLYTDTEPQTESGLISRNDGGTPGDPTDDTWTQGHVSLGAAVIDGQVRYPAVDVMGNLVSRRSTSDKGAYSFDKLRSGRYFVAFADDDNSYQVNNGTKRISFDRLSVTKLPANMPTGSPVNRTEADYGTNVDSVQSGAAALAGAFADNAGQGISLPDLNRIQSGKYVSGNWNCGLYYLDLTIRKDWENIYVNPIQKDTSVTFTVQASVGTEDVVNYSSDYVMTADNDMKADNAAASVTVTKADSLVDTQGTARTDGGALTVLTTGGKSVVKAGSTVTWLLEHRALQAEGRGGKITYSLTESATGADGKVLPGFRMSSTDWTEKDVRTFQAINTQILYRIDLTKLSSVIAKDADGKPLPQALLSGAQFTLYRDAGLSDTGKVVAQTRSDGKVIFEHLEAGTYYLKETKAPNGYDLNASVYEVKIVYLSDQENEEQQKLTWKHVKPVITVSQLKDEDGAALAQPKLLTEETAQPDGSFESEVPADEMFRTSPHQSVVTKDSDLTKVPVQYNISFRIEDDCLYELPSTGGPGTQWNTLIGMAMLMTALLLMERKRRAAAQ